MGGLPRSIQPQRSTQPHAHHYADGRIKIHDPGQPTRTVSRRTMLGAVGVGVAATALGPLASPAHADQSSPTQPVPNPIPGGVDDPLAGFIHFYLPGPEGSATPIIGLQGMGLDVEPSTMTDFWGYTAFAVVAGEATGSDGGAYPFEADIRVMDGVYLDDSGRRREGVYAFF